MQHRQVGHRKRASQRYVEDIAFVAHAYARVQADLGRGHDRRDAEIGIATRRLASGTSRELAPVVEGDENARAMRRAARDMSRRRSMPTRHLGLPILRLAGACLLSAACARAQHESSSAPEPTSVASHAVTVAADGPRDADAPSATPPSDALRTASGLAYVVLAPGTGTEHPGTGAKIRAHYIGWTASDLARFDDSYARGEPIAFVAEHVIKGWGEAIQRMVTGERIRVWIPEDLAYQGKPNLPAGMLIFDIELVDFTPAP